MKVSITFHLFFRPKLISPLVSSFSFLQLLALLVLFISNETEDVSIDLLALPSITSLAVTTKNTMGPYDPNDRGLNKGYGGIRAVRMRIHNEAGECKSGSAKYMSVGWISGCWNGSRIWMYIRGKRHRVHRCKHPHFPRCPSVKRQYLTESWAWLWLFSVIVGYSFHTARPYPDHRYSHR